MAHSAMSNPNLLVRSAPLSAYYGSPEHRTAREEDDLWGTDTFRHDIHRFCCGHRAGG